MNDQTPRPGARIIARAVLAAAGLPLAVGGIAAGLVLRWRDDLPSTVATHWGTSGSPDDFSSVTTVAWLVLGFSAGLAAIGLALVVAVRFEPVVSRVVAATSAGTAGFVAVLAAGLTEKQRGLADAAEADLSAGPILGALAAGAALALVATLLVPVWRTAPAVPADAPRLPVGDGERVMWTRSVATGSLPAAVLIAGVGVTAVAGLIGRQWWVLLLSLAMALLVLLMFSITVTVDRRGLTVRGRLGWPRMNTPLTEIVRASVVEVHPIRHFGGYGYRVAAFGPLRGAVGYVLHGGEALLIERTSGRRTVVVVDDAAVAAGLLNTLVEQTPA
ncbi:DUF1648 domain-containing protein [Jiangella gansuensis]|uniref:DUF1648 domain-containing protein n=1 Tax=Jiangella gansuensis TaxID=281473 RepID=UPI00047BF585|nr:DUF1648 domain-containing protein [Jiangella gansuensis]